MLNLKNDVGSLKELFEKKERVVLYGAGASARLLLKSYYSMYADKNLEFIVDGNENLDGKYCDVDDNIRIKIISLKHFCQLCGEQREKFTLLFTPYYSLFIIKELDKIEALDQMEAYVYSFLVNETPPGVFSLKSLDKPVIPKIIHYFWIGDSRLPEEYEKNIESWRKFCPDYEIIQWNESNYDFGKYRYTREALKSRQYMYATDLARKDVLYQYGGIYFDTDVELLRPIDELLYNEAFIGIDDGGQLNSGSGLGCVKHNQIIGEMLELYRDKAFIKEDGSLNLHYNTFYETDLMIKKGYKIKNEYQRIEGMSCFPREVFMPEGTVGVVDNYTDKTVSNHKINPFDKNQIAGVRDRLYGKKQLALYGAGMVAVSVYYAIKALYQVCDIVCFIVSDKKGNPTEIDGVPVTSLDEFFDRFSQVDKEQSREERCPVQVLIATPENHHSMIIADLEKRGWRDYICIDSKKEAALIEAYYKAIGRFPSLHSYMPGEKETSLEVYMTRFHKDMPLKNPYNPPQWIHPIQAGAALTENHITDIRDDTGDNISQKNVNYSELSAMYWVGRNAACKTHTDPQNSANKYLGLFHYRRILDIADVDLYRIEENDIDVILPYPTVHYPSIDEHHRRYLKNEDWEAMAAALKELEPEYEKHFSRIFSQPYFYNYNMFIAKERIFRDYCDWLFPILKRTEELSSPKGWERADRYIGYLGENLTTLYFMCHENDFRIAHTGRLMLI